MPSLEHGALYDRRRAEYLREQASKAEAKAEVLLKILASRGITLTPEQTGTITTCVDPRVVDKWVDRALIATTAADLFG
jgi:hypothetical protein